MEFRDFEATMAKFRPDVKVFRHGEFAECQKNRKVSVIFNYGKKNESRVYDYSGSYAQILRKFDIPCMSKDEYGEMLQRLDHYKKWHGKEDFFQFDGEPKRLIDHSEDIAKIEAKIAEIEAGKLLVV